MKVVRMLPGDIFYTIDGERYIVSEVTLDSDWKAISYLVGPDPFTSSESIIGEQRFHTMADLPKRIVKAGRMRQELTLEYLEHCASDNTAERRFLLPGDNIWFKGGVKAKCCSIGIGSKVSGLSYSYQVAKGWQWQTRTFELSEISGYTPLFAYKPLPLENPGKSCKLRRMCVYDCSGCEYGGKNNGK